MKGTVNPFEPWRPVETRNPPPLHASRPWRPPPPPPARAAAVEPLVVEPVKLQPRTRPQKRQEIETARNSVLNTPLSFLQAIRVIFFVIMSPLAIAGMCVAVASLGWLQETHLTRLAASGGCAIALVGFALSGRYSWHTRLTGMVIALALAGFALWFVPTGHGVSLWSAYRRIEELRALPAGDVAGYQHGAVARRRLVREFPSLAPDVSEAEQAWLRRTVAAAIEDSDRRLDKDPDAALAQLHQLYKDLSRLEHYASVRKDLESARRRAVQACLKVAQQP